MLCQALTLKTFKTFAADECAAISVDFVVLTGAATAMGLATMSAFSAEIGFISGAVAASAQHEETRPSFAYRAHDEETYVRYTAAVSSLSNSDLAILAAWGNQTRNQRANLTDENAVRFFDDFDNAITTAYANRDQSRDEEEVEYEDYDLERVSRMLGFSTDRGAL